MNKWMILAVFASVLFLQACKHPLAVVGNGDIVDVNNSGHGCTLKQFQAEDAACTENEVSGDYFINYKAMPSPGWRFVRWDGPCSPNSDFQHCRLDASKELVAWWEETYPDLEIPPSTAVFQPITGETGYLVGPGPFVAGVSYTTPSQQGVTGLDGSFQYAQGDTVRFKVGSTVLGEVVGKPQVSPFDLADSPIHTGIQITWALQDENDPFHAVINLAVFLQSLDHDANPDNGIEIRPGVTALLQKVKLDFHRPWGKFLSDSFRNQSDVIFRHMLGRAKRNHRFSVSHGIVKPAAALDSLYRALGTEPRTVGLIRQQNPEDVETWQYDADGDVERHENSAFGQDAFETWQYDVDGNATQHEQYANEFGHFRVDTWQYNVNGNVTRYEVESSGAFSPRHEVVNYLYDADHNQTRTVTERYRDEGNVEIVESFHYGYGIHGNLRQFTYFDADTIDTSGQTARYDANGNQTQFGFLDADGTVEVLYSWRYDANSNLLREEFAGLGQQILKYDADDNVILIRNENRNGVSISRFEYDSNGNVTRIETVDAEDDSVESIETWRYDNNGNVTFRENVDKDGAVEELETWQYDEMGNLVRYECDGSNACEDVYESFPTHRIDTFQYYANGGVRLHEIEATVFDLGVLPGPSTVSESWRLQYDLNGNLTRVETDSRRSGQPARISTWQYDNDGKLTRHEFDDDGDGIIEETNTYQYQATGWGHLFSAIEMFGHNFPPPLKPSPNQDGQLAMLIAPI